MKVRKKGNKIIKPAGSEWNLYSTKEVASA